MRLAGKTAGHEGTAMQAVWMKGKQVDVSKASLARNSSDKAERRRCQRGAEKGFEQEAEANRHESTGK